MTLHRCLHTIRAVFLFLVVLFVCFCLIIGGAYCRMQRRFTAAELSIPELHSDRDFDADGIDDYTDICRGAQSYIATHPVYGSRYYAGGYPDDGYGVCTDVVWQAFAAAGYDLKSMVDADIAAFPEAYPAIAQPDPNIDFRRVRNLRIFFDRHAEVLTTDLSRTDQWQAGDIVIFSPSHIAICSDVRNAQGAPFLIHHPSLLEGAVERNDWWMMPVAAHYRWNPHDLECLKLATQSPRFEMPEINDITPHDLECQKSAACPHALPLSAVLHFSS